MIAVSDFSVVIEVCLQENIISAIEQFLLQFRSKLYTNLFFNVHCKKRWNIEVCFQAHSVSVLSTV